MARYGLLVDMNRCDGCYACFLACRDEFCGNDYPPYSAAQPYSGHFWMRIVERERGLHGELVARKQRLEQHLALLEPDAGSV